MHGCYTDEGEWEAGIYPKFSTEKEVLYLGCDKKELPTLEQMRIHKKFTDIFTHDHETAIYPFWTGHGKFNIHLERYLLKNTEETRNGRSRQMSGFLKGMNHAQKVLKQSGTSSFAPEQLKAPDMMKLSQKV